MDIKQLIHDVKVGYNDAGLDQLEVWQGQLSTEFAWIASNVGEVKRDRAQDEIIIHSELLMSGVKPTEKMIERKYYASDKGMYLALNTEMLKALSKLISAVRFKIEALRGKI